MKKTRCLYTIGELGEAVVGSICWTDVCKSLKVSVCTYNMKRIQMLCIEHNISTEHFDRKEAYARNHKRRRTFDEIFCKDSPISRSSLRECCMRHGLHKSHCEECGVKDMWNGKPLTIEVDHVNGNNTDHRVENLRWLCPNCHSQTPTYRRRMSERPE